MRKKVILTVHFLLNHAKIHVIYVKKLLTKIAFEDTYKFISYISLNEHPYH